MKRKYLAIILIITVFAIIKILYIYSAPNYGNDLASMESIINEKDIVAAKTGGQNIIIYDLVVIENYKIVAFTKESEPVEFHSVFGYAVFEADDDDNYVFKTVYIRTSDRSDILIDYYSINDIMYNIIVCNQEISAAKRIIEQTGEETYIKIEEGHAIALMEQPDLPEINAYYCVYDNNGNIIE